MTTACLCGGTFGAHAEDDRCLLLKDAETILVRHRGEVHYRHRGAARCNWGCEDA